MIELELQTLKIACQHPFVVKLHCAFHDKTKCYFVFDLLVGGDLRYHLKKKVVFNEKRTGFVVACLSSALEYLHSKRVMHRDVKPVRSTSPPPLYLRSSNLTL